MLNHIAYTAKIFLYGRIYNATAEFKMVNTLSVIISEIIVVQKRLDKDTAICINIYSNTYQGNVKQPGGLG